MKPQIIFYSIVPIKDLIINTEKEFILFRSDFLLPMRKIIKILKAIGFEEVKQREK